MQCPYFSISEYGMFNSNVKFPKIITTPDRLVESFEIEYFTHDCPGETYINNDSYLLTEGTIICAKPGQFRHSRLPFKCNYVHIATEDEALIGLLKQIPDHFIPGKVPELTQIFNDMLTIEAIDNPQNRIFLESCVCRLIWQLMQLKHLNTESQAGIAVMHQKLLLDAEKYIKEHLPEELSLASLSAYCNLSPAYFHRLFTAYFEKTPAQYVLDCRISAAKIGLLTSEYPLSRIAADCGFTSQAYFCYKFKQTTGYTPLQYRKDMLSRMKV